MLKIAVGSTNPAKVRAVQQVMARVWPQAEVQPVAVPSGVSAMPLSERECLIGARRRAIAARNALDADYGVGLEGGVSQDPAGLLLLGWVVIVDREGREGIGGTGRLPLPDAIARRVLAGEELGPVMDSLLGERKSNHRGGAIGALTAGLVPRSDAFALAVAYALSPFVAAEYYR